MRSDFADIFEVRSHTFTRRGRTGSTGITTGGADHPLRSTGLPSAVGLSAGRLRLAAALRERPGGLRHGSRAAAVLAHVRQFHPRRGRADPRPTRNDDRRHANADGDRLQRRWLDRATALTSANEDVYRAYRQSSRTWARCGCTSRTWRRTSGCPRPACPGSSPLFGRDSLIVSLQNMIVYAAFARGALQRAGRVPGDRDATTGATPSRARSRTSCGSASWPTSTRSRTRPYYGTADATPLYLIVLHEAWKWLGDDGLLERYRRRPRAAWTGSTSYGDLDGDGFQEYQTALAAGLREHGLEGRGRRGGLPGRQPGQAAQGAVRAAGLRLRRQDAHGRDLRCAAASRDRAASCAPRRPSCGGASKRRFWCEELGFYAFGLDPDKQPIKTIASNAGPLPVERASSARTAPRGSCERLLAARHVERLGHPHALGAEPGLQPVSPTSAARSGRTTTGSSRSGFKRYGFADEASRVARDIFEAASYFLATACRSSTRASSATGQLPGAVPRRQHPAGLGGRRDLPADAGHAGPARRRAARRLYVDPTLPPWLPDVTLRGLEVGGAPTLRFWREGDRTRWDVLALTGDIQVAEQRWSARASAARRRCRGKPAESDA